MNVKNECMYKMNFKKRMYEKKECIWWFPVVKGLH